jgi:hypothetical protein
MVRMARSMMACATCGLLLLALSVAPAHAQIESSQVLDDSTLAPLARSRVILQHGAADSWTDVDTLAEWSRQSLLAARFEPATIGGIPVRQLVTRKERFVSRIERPVIR